MKALMSYDDVAWENSDAVADTWQAQYIFPPECFRSIGEFLVEHYGTDGAFEFTGLPTGGFNISLQMKFADNSAAVIRFPIPGYTMFPEEKGRNEVAIMRFIAHKSSIPVPFIAHWGGKGESPLKMSPFIIMDYVKHHQSMMGILKMPDRPQEEYIRLNPNIEEAKLRCLYRDLARVMLLLSQQRQNKIGSLYQVDEVTWEVTRRPLSLHMNELVRLGTLPQSKLPTTTFDTASSYFEALAELHISHLINQRNDAVDSADDCRRKFVARFLFRKLVREQKFKRQWIFFENGKFPIWCDDFRPGNVLVDEAEKIAGVVDWEFTYAAPVEFTHAPPWWLILTKPEAWAEGLEDWCKEYTEPLQTFLRAMKDCEDEAIRTNRLAESDRLSGWMERSWQSGDFWIMYAARNNFAFDGIYWKKIDQRFFGRIICGDSDICDAWKERLHLLEPEEQELMEKEVKRKLKEMKTRPLAWDPDEYTREWMERPTDDGTQGRAC